MRRIAGLWKRRWSDRIRLSRSFCFELRLQAPPTQSMSESITEGPRRRNGRVASCEPCRKAKIRCDHGRPVCSRCRRRALQSECYYHPAPLTKPSTSNRQEDAALNGPILAPKSITQSQTNGSVADTLSSAPSVGSVRSHENISVLNGSSVQSGPRRFTYSKQTGEHIAIVSKVLSQMRHMDEISRLCQSYYASNQACIVPSCLILPALAPISALVEQHGLFRSSSDEPALSRWAEAVVRSTSTAVSITATLTPAEFVRMHTGANLRLEYLGIILCLAARSTIFELAQENDSYDAFIRDLYWCSTACLRLARELTPLNDAMTWLSVNDFTLTTSIEGDSSKWHPPNLEHCSLTSI